MTKKAFRARLTELKTRHDNLISNAEGGSQDNKPSDNNKKTPGDKFKEAFNRSWEGYQGGDIYY